jgi:tetratricopeptide (TPR) repeat protein
MQLLETQVLLGNDRSLTLALRRSNGPLPCTSEWVSRAILSDAELPGLPNDDGRAAVDRLWEATRQVREGIPNGRDSIGCRPGVFRRALNALDIMPLPTAEDERIANVTARGLEGDARLSTALHFAALQAMEHLSSVGLAVYYDNTSKYQSSFDFYKKSVPDLLREAHEAAPYIEGFARRELAIAFIRIGDFQSQLRNECVASDKSHQLSERAYRLAVAVYPGDLQVLARVGYGYLIRAKEREWAAQFCGRSGDSSDFLGKSVERLKEAVQAGERPEALRRHGLVRRDEMLGWAYANLAYALTVYHTGRNSPYGDPAIMAKKAVGSSHEEDLRALAANVYVRSRVAPPCATIRQELDKIEDPVSAGPALSLHNYLLIEEQLWATYDLAIKSCPNEFHTEPLRGSWHKFVFESLLALDYLQSGITNPDQVFAGLDNDSGRIDELRKNADISAAITLRRAILKEDSKAAETKSGVCSVREATGSPASAIARAQSLCAKIESIQCTPGSDWFRMASRAVNSSRDDPYLRANLCTVLLKSNKPAEALTAIQDAVRLNPGEPRLRYLLGFALAGSGHAEEAHDQYEYGRALDPAGWPGVLQYFEGKLAPCNPNPIGKVDALPVEEGGTVRESPSHRHNASRSKKHGLEKILER